MNQNFSELIHKAKYGGFAVGVRSFLSLRLQAENCGLSAAPIRKGDEILSTLKPVKKRQARPNSLSARYGTGRQPFHTDGAHLPEPPDFILLGCGSTNETPTKLLKINYMKLSGAERTALSNGVFLVGSGSSSFFSSIRENDITRYDPGCMIPCDGRAKEAQSLMEGQADFGTDHIWDEPDKFILINNHQVLHARGDASDEPSREILRVAFWVKETV